MQSVDQPERAIANDLAAIGFDILTTEADQGWLRLHVTCDLDIAAETAWNAFKTFGAIDGWHPATMHCGLILGEEGRPGAIREFEVQGGGYVMSELLAYDEAERHFRYRILKTSLPLYSYVGEMWVETKEEGCTVHWAGAFKRPLDAGSDQDEPTRTLVQGVFTSGLDGIRSKVGA